MTLKVLSRQPLPPVDTTTRKAREGAPAPQAASRPPRESALQESLSPMLGESVPLRFNPIHAGHRAVPSQLTPLEQFDLFWDVAHIRAMGGQARPADKLLWRRLGNAIVERTPALIQAMAKSDPKGAERLQRMLDGVDAQAEALAKVTGQPVSTIKPELMYSLWRSLPASAAVQDLMAQLVPERGGETPEKT